MLFVYYFKLCINIKLTKNKNNQSSRSVKMFKNRKKGGKVEWGQITEVDIIDFIPL